MQKNTMQDKLPYNHHENDFKGVIANEKTIIEEIKAK